MKHKKYSWNIFVYLSKYLKKWNLNKKNFQALKSDLPLYKVFAGLKDFLKVIGESHELCMFFAAYSNFVSRKIHKQEVQLQWTPDIQKLKSRISV